jgi:hypothetical protein
MSGRREAIALVEQAILADRNVDYDSPENNFGRIADFHNIYLEGKTEVTPYDVAIMQVLTKIARAMKSPHVLDHVVDMAGYALCAADVLPSSPDADVPAEVKESVATDGGLPGDVEAVYEGVSGFIRNSIWHGSTGRKIIVRDIDMAVREGVLVVS